MKLCSNYEKILKVERPKVIGSMTDLTTRTAWLYYKEGLKESRIATMLGLSRSKVGRLLQKARENGIVHFQVLGTGSNCLEIEKKTSIKVPLNLLNRGD
jgi:DNA-binding transcriptional regulator LsrR (DeoR family)